MTIVWWILWVTVALNDGVVVNYPVAKYISERDCKTAQQEMEYEMKAFPEAKLECHNWARISYK